MPSNYDPKGTRSQEYDEAALEWFTHKMLRKLEANRHKGGWDSTDVLWLLARLVDEAGELAKAILSKDALSTEHEAADVANFAMMIADRALHGGLDA